MTDIYEQHRAAFAKVSAYVILKDGERVATIAFKFGNAVTAYVHWIGLEMTRGTAGGGGYDRQSAACLNAANKLVAYCQARPSRKYGEQDYQRAVAAGLDSFLNTFDRGERGAGWERALRDAGFTVLQAV